MRIHRFPVLLAATLATLQLAACGKTADHGFQGYVEGDFLYLASPQAGYLKSLAAPRGSRIAAGQPAFLVMAAPDDQALAEAQARADAAREKVANLQTPHRPSEIAALEAELRSAQAALRLAGTELQQQEALAARHFVAPTKVDAARSAHDQAAARVDAAKEQIATYRNSLGRQPEVRGAEADLAAATAVAAQKRWQLERKAVMAPAAGEIAETYYQPGEWVPAGAAVARLLPDGKRRLRFFVPETAVATIHRGDGVEARCDGCPTPIRARVDFVAPEAEYTPPVIYSQGSREKLVFRVEALPAPEQAAQLRPGLPVDVRLVR